MSILTVVLVAVVTVKAHTVTPVQIDVDPIAQRPSRIPVRRMPARPAPRQTPKAQPQIQTPPVTNAPTPDQLAKLYMKVGRELQAIAQVDRNKVIDLWPRYRWVNFMEAIRTPQKRAEAAELLEKLLAEAEKLRP